MSLLRGIVLGGLLCCQLAKTYAQPLPIFSIDRRMDSQYMNGLARLARQQYQVATSQPPTAHNDTLRFEALHYLGKLYSWWEGKQDSSLYFAGELTRQARLRRNVAYDVKGILLSEFYYHDLRGDYPEALRLNYQAKSILQKARQDPMLNWRIDLNLGALYSISGDYENALKFLNSARVLINKGSGVSPTSTILNQADIEEKTGIVYEDQGNLSESENHYLAAEKILSRAGMKTNLGFIYEVLSALYLKTEAYDKALTYAKKAEPLWESMDSPYSISTNWSILAAGYAGTGQNDQALRYALKVLKSKPILVSARERAYLALQKIYENRHDWQQSLFYYKQYVAVSDTTRNVRQAKKLASIQKKSELELLTIQNQQEQQLQTQRLLTVRKQAELDRLRSIAQTDALAKKAYLSEQQRQFENERAKTALHHQRTAQQLQQQAFEQKELQQENKAQQTMIFSIISSSVLLLGILALLLYSAQLRKRKAEADLLLAHERKEADALIMQTQEVERQRIAADLHDDLGGTLATIRRRITDLRQYLHDPSVVRAFDDLEPLIQKSNDDLRRIAHNLMPPEFARIGLRDSVQQLVSSQPPQPTQFSFITSGKEHKLPLATELNVYRIVSELIQNTNKHAQADRAAVQLLYQHDHLTITVEDDGMGNRRAKTNEESGGIGLKNSSLRAEYIGAKLWREASEGGTLVVLDVPYATMPDAAQQPYPNPAD